MVSPSVRLVKTKAEHHRWAEMLRILTATPNRRACPLSIKSCVELARRGALDAIEDFSTADGLLAVTPQAETRLWRMLQAMSDVGLVALFSEGKIIGDNQRRRSVWEATPDGVATLADWDDVTADCL
jgi:hypothetical protein